MLPGGPVQGQATGPLPRHPCSRLAPNLQADRENHQHLFSKAILPGSGLLRTRWSEIHRLVSACDGCGTTSSPQLHGATSTGLRGVKYAHGVLCTQKKKDNPQLLFNETSAKITWGGEGCHCPISAFIILALTGLKQ